jgi:hypothetical protein
MIHSKNLTKSPQNLAHCHSVNLNICKRARLQIFWNLSASEMFVNFRHFTPGESTVVVRKNIIVFTDKFK